MPIALVSSPMVPCVIFLLTNWVFVSIMHQVSLSFYTIETHDCIVI